MSGRCRRGGRDGFALLVTLWVLSGMAVLGLLLHRTAGEAIGATQNRNDAMRATWEMEGCLARAQAAIDEALRAADDVAGSWANLDRRMHEDLGLRGCQLDLRPVGITLDVNVADRGRLLALFVAAGVPYERGDSIAAAIVDWRDADDDEQRGGAEGGWYRAAGRPGPRNAPFAAVEELRLVRGLESLDGLDVLLGVESGRVLLTRAPPPLLATLPGFGAEAVARLTELRAAAPVDLPQLAASLSRDAQALLQEHYMELVSMVVASPDAWVVTSRVTRPATGATSSIEILLLRSGRRAAIMRHRSSPWS